MLGGYLRDVIRANPTGFRLFGPDETASNRLTPVFEATDRAWDAETLSTDDHLAPGGRVMEVLSEHQCQGWLEGYLLTGRHGLFNCYEAFVHIVDSMFNQHAKWLKVTRDIPWRRPVASLNYLLSSHVWRQDHNGFSHQDPGFIDHVVNKKAEIIRVYLPPDANCLLSVTDHCLRSRNYVNVIVAGKQPSLDYLSMEDAILHCTRGIGIWEWASNDDGEPDVVMACCGDIPTLETLAAVDILRRELPSLKVRVVNVVDLMRLQPDAEHPHGLSDREFDTLFTVDRPVVFAYHGYPLLIHRLTYRRRNHANLHVRGYKEEGTTTTPFDMVMLNDLDRFHLVMDVIDRVPCSGRGRAHLRQRMDDRADAVPGVRTDGGRRPARHPGVDLAVLSGPTTVRILVVNAGSSSLKLALLEEADRDAASETIAAPRGRVDEAELRDVIERCAPIDAVGHRIVHGGTEFVEPAVLSPEVVQRLRSLSDLAPLHQPKSLRGVDVIAQVLPGVPAVGCFDTAFHAGMPPPASTYALPSEWRRRWDLRRFGFHGLSHSWICRRTAELMGQPVEEIRVVQLPPRSGGIPGAVDRGRSVDTTMGFTPLEGLVMATRSGQHRPRARAVARGACGDAAIRARRHPRASFGLLGLTGTADMRSILTGRG